MNMFERDFSRFGFIVAMLVVVLAVFFSPKLVFNYDFEHFFSTDDPELLFYNAHRDRFENDNDYLLVALGRGNGDVFDPDFLDAALKVEKGIRELDRVREVISLLELEEPLLGNFGVRNRRVLEWGGKGSLEKSKSRVMDDPNWQANLISEDGKFILMLVLHEENIAKEDGDDLYLKISEVLTQSPIAEIHTAGKIKAQGEFVDLLQTEFATFLAISFILVMVWLYIVYRKVWAILLPLFILSTGMFLALTVLLLSGGQLDVLLVMQPPILLIIGLSGMIHFLTFYFSLIKEGMAKEKAIISTFSQLGIAVFLTSITTSLGFLSLYLTQIPSLKNFGLYTGIGVLIMFIAIILIMPYALYLLPSPVKQKRQTNEHWFFGLRNSYQWVLNNRAFIHFGFVLLSLFSVYGFASIKTDGYLLDNLPDDHGLIQDFRFFDERFGGSKPLEIHLEVGGIAETLMEYEVLKEINKVGGFLQKHFETGFLVSPVTRVMAGNKAQNQGNPKAFDFPTEGQFDRLKPRLEKLMEKDPMPILTPDWRKGRISSRMPDIGSHKGGELYAQLEEFIANEIDEGLLRVNITGTSYLIDRSHNAITEQLIKGLGIAFGIVAIIAGILFRSWRMSFIALLPNVIPLLWLGGVMNLLGLDFKLSMSIIFAVAFGIAVDDSIHFMAKLRLILGKGNGLLYATKRTFFTTGKAIILTTLVLASGFLVLTLSSFEITFYTGFLIALALIFALLADLLWLPLLLAPMHKVWDQKFKGRFQGKPGDSSR